MPVIHVHARQPSPPAGLLRGMCAKVCEAVGAPPDKVWALWHHVEADHYARPDWDEASVPGPTVEITCRQEHAKETVERMMRAVRAALAAGLDCRPESVFVAVHRVAPGESMQVTTSLPTRGTPEDP